ncbi:MAG: dihydropteroate synthase [Burkholderiales bacterium]
MPASRSLLHCGKFKLSLDSPLIMGIVNVTPDSFSDGFLTTESAIAHARRLIAEGADIVDIGGESTRPGAQSVSLDQERSRVLPVIQGLSDFGVPLSIDTSKPDLMRDAIRAGAAMINDVNALQAPGALEVAADSGAAVCLMHMQGTPQTMQLDPRYDDVVGEIKLFLVQRVAAAMASGIARERIVVDPGFGFGKTKEHNLELFRRLRDFADLDVPLLAGLSRKSVLGKLTGRDPGDRVYASVASALLAVIKGASIVRVHDVAATRDALAVYNSVSGKT